MKLKSLGSMSLITATAIALLTTGCGGGGGTSTTTPVSATSTVTLSGTVVVASPTMATSALSIGKSAIDNSGESIVSGAFVNITSFDKNNLLLSDVNITTREEGSFDTNISMSTNGGYILMTARKEGMAEYTKRIDYDTNRSINIKAVLDEMATIVSKVPTSGDMNISSAVVKSADGIQYVEFALFKNSVTGKSQILVGKNAAIKKSAGSVPDLDILIPLQGLKDANVTALKADLKSYNPNTDESKFPGRYADSSGNRLVSLGFDAINIETDKGENLGALSKRLVASGKLKKSATTGTTITRHIYKDNCSILSNGDVNTSVDGFQLPIYTYNSYKNNNAGAWDYLGVGTIVESNGSTITNFSNWNGSAVKHCEDGNSKNSGEYIKIAITNEDFLKYWWNLDYPLKPKLPDMCVQGDFRDQNGNALTKSFYITLADDDANTSFTTQYKYTTDGHYKIETFSNDTPVVDKIGKLSYYNYDTYTYEPVTNVALGTDGECLTKNITITVPPKCRLNGKVVDDNGTAAANKYVAAYSASPYSWRSGTTDSKGNYAFDVKCGVTQELYVNSQATGYKILPNGLRDQNETADITLANSNGGYEVNATTIPIPDSKPYAYGYLSTKSMKSSGNGSVWIYGYDADAVDNPVNFTLKFGSAKPITGTGSSSYLYKTYNLADFNLTEGSYPVTLEVIGKAHPNVKTSTNLGTLEIVADNRRPMIDYAYSRTKEGSIGIDISLRGKGYDLDGDALTGTWSETTVAAGSVLTRALPCTGDGNGSVELSCDYRPTSEGTKTLTFSVKDIKGLQEDKNVTVNVVDHAPVITFAGTKNGKYSGSIQEIITLLGNVTELDGQNVTMSWAAGASTSPTTPIVYTDINCTTTSTTSTGVSTCNYTLPNAAGTVYFKFTATDGKKVSSQQFSVIAGEGELAITVQKK